jgi:hypothetical protein
MILYPLTQSPSLAHSCHIYGPRHKIITLINIINTDYFELHYHRHRKFQLINRHYLPNMVNKWHMPAYKTKQNKETVTTEYKLLKSEVRFSNVMLTTANVTVRVPSFIPVVAPIMKSIPITPSHFQQHLSKLKFWFYLTEFI